MATLYSPKIVTNSLVLILDAANGDSYSGSGTTLFDLSGNGNSGTLVNGASYNTNNGGSFFFDGVNDYMETQGGTNFTPNDNFSIFCTFSGISISNPTAVTDNTSVIFGKGITAGSYGIGLNYNQITDVYTLRLGVRSESNVFLTHDVTYTPNTIVNVGMVYSPGTCKFYLNGAYITVATNQSILSSTLDTGNYFSFFTNPVYGGNGRWAQGRLYSAMVYSKALTNEEVFQNYNATKGRFGL
jgi:hypothetical protein